MLQYFLMKEGNDYRFDILEVENDIRRKVDRCDRIAAESLALEAEEAGIKVEWEYLEDQVLASRR